MERSKKSADNVYEPSYLLDMEDILFSRNCSILQKSDFNSFYNVEEEYVSGKIFLTNYRLIYHFNPKTKKNSKKVSYLKQTPRSTYSSSSSDSSTTSSSSNSSEEERIFEDTQPDISIPLLSILNTQTTSACNCDIRTKIGEGYSLEFSKPAYFTKFIAKLMDHAFPVNSITSTYAFKYNSIFINKIL